MQCADITRLLSEGHLPHEIRSRPECGAHVVSCANCRPLVEWAAAPFTVPGVPEPVVSRIREIVRTDLTPVRPLPSIGVVLGGAFILTALLAGLVPRVLGTQGWAEFSIVELAPLTGLAGLVLSTALVSLLDSIRPGIRQHVHPLVPVLLHGAGYPVLVFILFPFRPSPHFYADGIFCLSAGLAVSAGAAVISYLITRRGYSTNAGRTGALIGAVAGVAGSVGLQMTCPNHEAGHMSVWHGLVILTPIAAGYLMASHAGVILPKRL